MLDGLIIGSGLAGTALADAWCQRTQRLGIITSHDPLAGSTVPLGLMHAFQGPVIRPSPQLIDAYATSLQWLQRWRRGDDDPVLTPCDMTRPLFDDDRSARLERSLHRFQDHLSSHTSQAMRWDAIGPTLQVLDRPALVQRAPALRARAALFYAPAFAVQVPRLIKRILDTLTQDHGLTVEHADVTHLERHGDHWAVHTSIGVRRAHHVVLAMGGALRTWFEALDLYVTGGEVITGKGHVAGCEGLGASASGGYIGWTSDGQWGAGSTFWRLNELNQRQDRDAIDHIMARIIRFMPSAGELAVTSTWRGVRAVFPEGRAPLVGSVPGWQGLHVIGALGAKGLRQSRWCADQLLGHIMDGAKIDAAISTTRLAEGRWRTSRVVDASG